MEINEIIKDALNYPFSDFKKFLMLGLPNLILGILFMILSFQVVGLSEISDLPVEALVNSSSFSTFFIVWIIFILAAILGAIIIQGIMLSVIKETIRNNDVLPSIDLKTNFIDGLKSIVLTIVYVFIPAILYVLLISGILVSGDSSLSVILTLVLSIVFIGVFIVISSVYVTSLGRFAETGSISDSLKIRDIYETTKLIGIGKIFVIIILCNLLNLAISVIGNLIIFIPIIGILITVYILYTYYFIFNARCYGLVYRDRFVDISDTLELEDKSTDNLPLDVDSGSDIVVADDSDDDVRKCGACGFSNPGYYNICDNCGKEL